MRYVLIIVILFLAGQKTLAQPDAQMEKMNQLISKWHERDGALVYEANYDIAKALVSSDTAFFKTMKSDTAAFRAWKKELYLTFTLFGANDIVEDSLYTAYFEKLRSMMKRHCQKFIDHKKYGTLAGSLIRRLEEIEIRYID